MPRIKTKPKIIIFIIFLSIPLLVQAAEDSEMIGYLQKIYKFGIGAIGIVAALVLMLGGLTWITAMGNAQRVGEAKAWIAAALSGLLIALFSWLILNTINPSLVNPRINKPNIPAAKTNYTTGGGFGEDSYQKEKARQEKAKELEEKCNYEGGNALNIAVSNQATSVCNTYCVSMAGDLFIGVVTYTISSGPQYTKICCTCRTAPNVDSQL